MGTVVPVGRIRPTEGTFITTSGRLRAYFLRKRGMEGGLPGLQSPDRHPSAWPWACVQLWGHWYRASHQSFRCRAGMAGSRVCLTEQ